MTKKQIPESKIALNPVIINDSKRGLPPQKWICPHCGDVVVKHIRKEGARYHVHSWYKGKNGALQHCSEPNCEENHGEGHCVPYSKETLERLEQMRNRADRGGSIFEGWFQ